MSKYFQAAFFLRYPTKWFGRVPLNIIGLAAFAVLGFGHPGFWLIGAACEAAYLAALTSSARFRRYVTGMELAAQSSTVEVKRQALVKQLDSESQARLAAVEKRSARVIDLYEGQGAEAYLIDASREALHRLRWMYLKLLMARNYLKSEESVNTQEKLTRDVAALERELSSEKLSPALRESKTATLDIFRKRLDNLERREQSLKEIDSDLQRIEAQIELAVDEAAMKGKPQAISASIDLVTQLLDVGNFADSESSAIQELEHSYQAPMPQAQRQ